MQRQIQIQTTKQAQQVIRVIKVPIHHLVTILHVIMDIKRKLPIFQTLAMALQIQIQIQIQLQIQIHLSKYKKQLKKYHKQIIIVKYY